MNGNLSAVFLVGKPGVGKTTIIKKIFESSRQCGSTHCNGFYTEEVRNASNKRIGFEIITMNGDTATLAVVSETQKGPRIGKYVVNVENFESLALPILRSNSKFLIIDEIGKMELLSKNFEIEMRKLLPKIAAEEIKIIASIPNQPIPIVKQLTDIKNSKTYEITESNRNIIVNEIENICKKMYQ